MGFQRFLRVRACVGLRSLSVSTGSTKVCIEYTLSMGRMGDTFLVLSFLFFCEALFMCIALCDS